MSYGVRWKPEADEDFARIAARHPVAPSFILDQIDRLAEDPIRLCRRPSFPHLPLPKFQFWATAERVFLHVTVLFRYAQDEQFLEVLAIGIVESDEPPEEIENPQ